MKISAEDLWPLILDFVDSYFGADQFEEFKKHFDLEIEHSKDPLVQAGGLKAMLACFLKNNKQVYKSFKKSNKAKEEKSSGKKAKKEEKVGKKRTRKGSNVSEVSDAVPQKRKRAPSAVSSKSVESSGPITRRKASMDASNAATAPNKQAQTDSNKEVLFKRIDASKFNNKISTQFQDNSFEAKARFGEAGDTYGGWSNSKLHDKHGKNFIKEKNKMKNR